MATKSKPKKSAATKAKGPGVIATIIETISRDKGATQTRCWRCWSRPSRTVKRKG